MGDGPARGPPRNSRTRYDLVHVHLPLIGPAAARVGAFLPARRSSPSFYGPWGDEIRVELGARRLSGWRGRLYPAYVRGLSSGWRRGNAACYAWRSTSSC